jgi:hypothetical protein
MLNDGRLTCVEIGPIACIFLPRPWLSVDESQITRDVELECDSVRRVGDEIYARGVVRSGEGFVRLPYWHKVVRI